VDSTRTNRLPLFRHTMHAMRDLYNSIIPSRIRTDDSLFFQKNSRILITLGLIQTPEYLDHLCSRVKYFFCKMTVLALASSPSLDTMTAVMTVSLHTPSENSTTYQPYCYFSAASALYWRLKVVLQLTLTAGQEVNPTGTYSVRENSVS